MTNEEIFEKMEVLEESNLSSDFEDVFNWLNPGKKKDTVGALYDYCVLWQQYAYNLEKEVENLKNPLPEPVQKFFPMSTTARKRR